MSRIISSCETSTQEHRCKRKGLRVYISDKTDFQQNCYSDDSSMAGYYGHDDGIYLQRPKKFQVRYLAATIIHEISHYIFDILFENKAQPFSTEQDAKTFQEIINNTKEALASSQIMINIAGLSDEKINEEFLFAFNLLNTIFNNYPSAKHANELIVAVPEFYCLFGRDKARIYLIMLAPGLVEYFVDVVQPRMQLFITSHHLSFNNLRHAFARPRNTSIPLSDLSLATKEYLLFGSASSSEAITPKINQKPSTTTVKPHKNLKHCHR